MEDEFLYLWAQSGILNCDRYRALLYKFDTLEQAWKKITSATLAEIGVRKNTTEKFFELRERLSFEQITSIITRLNIKIYCLDDQDYPELLKELKKPPPFLFVRGKLPSFHKSLAIVGTRSMTDYGKNVTERFAADLVREGFVIVSGLALGVDSLAHKTAVKNYGITVAVLGSGVDLIYPSSNHRLARDILSSGGAIISTYPLGTPAFPHHFPARNEVIAGLCRGTLVTEGGTKSGALITAKEALDNGREVFAVPNNITKYALSGTNKKIRKGEAKLVETIDHILEDFAMQGTIMKEEKEFDDEEKLILKKLTSGGKTMDTLFEETQFDIPALSYILMRLALKSAVAQEGSRWVLI